MSKAIESAVFERRVAALFAPYSKPGSPGAVVGVMRDGEIAFCKGFGLASVELGVPIRPDTRFRIASVSNQFTVTASLMLAAEGKLKLSDPPHKYLPELAKTNYKGVTGQISFDAKGDIKNGALTLYTYKGGNREQIAVVR